MSNEIKITPQPLPRDPISRPEGIGSQNHPSVSDTTKVIKPNVKDDYNQNQPEGGKSDFNTQSIRAKTLRLFLNSETATEAAKRLFSGEALAMLESNSPEASKWAQFMGKFFLSPDELPTYLKEQLSNNSLFQGSFFDFLRNILNRHGNNPAIKDSLLQVLKSAELYQNRQNTTILLVHNLNNLLPFLSAKNQQALLDVIAALKNTLTDNSTLSSDTQRILMQILSETASTHRDQNALRNMIMLAIHNLSRLENSDKYSLLKSVDHFSATLQQYSKLSPEQQNQLMNALERQLQSTLPNHAAADRIMAALDFGLSSTNPLPLQMASSNILSALLLNQSVLLPLLYGFIPLQLDNTYLFSEMWAYVHDDENEKSSSAIEAPSNKITTVFFTMESSAFGHMQGTLEAQAKNLSLQLESPQIAIPFLQNIAGHLEPVVNKFGYHLTQSEVIVLEKPKRFIDVFGKKILKEASLNVQV